MIDKLQVVGVRGKGILFMLSLGSDGGVIFLFSAKRPLRKVQLSSYSRRAGQRRCFQRIYLADSYRGRPSLRSGSRSYRKSTPPFAPSYGLAHCHGLVALVTRTSMYLLLAITTSPDGTYITLVGEQLVYSAKAAI